MEKKGEIEREVKDENEKNHSSHGMRVSSKK